MVSSVLVHGNLKRMKAGIRSMLDAPNVTEGGGLRGLWGRRYYLF